MVNFSLRWRGVGFVVKLVAAKVVRQHMYFFTLILFLKEWSLKWIKKLIVLIHENHDKWPFCTLIQHFCVHQSIYLYMYFQVHGAWSNWHRPSQCSVSCGGGVRTRIRYCDHPAPANGGSYCPGSAYLQEPCNPTPCPGKSGFKMLEIR